MFYPIIHSSVSLDWSCLFKLHGDTPNMGFDSKSDMTVAVAHDPLAQVMGYAKKKSVILKKRGSKNEIK